MLLFIRSRKLGLPVYVVAKLQEMHLRKYIYITFLLLHMIWFLALVIEAGVEIRIFNLSGYFFNCAAGRFFYRTLRVVSRLA